MRKVILLSIISLAFAAKANSQTVTIHGSDEPVVLYNLTDGNFFKIITTDIWVYANGSYGAATPYTLQPVAPPTFNGGPMVDFRPMSCYDARSAWGQTAVVCGPYNEFVQGGQVVKSCGDSDNTTCKVTWVDGTGTRQVIWDVQVN